MGTRNLRRCWHCNGELSTLNVRPGVKYWATVIELEPGRAVTVHKCCEAAAKESIRKITAAPRDKVPS